MGQESRNLMTDKYIALKVEGSQATKLEKKFSEKINGSY